jgi:hypothetical protein
MKKPLNLPLLMRAIDELLVEPVEQRLSRLVHRFIDFQSTYLVS